MTRRPTYLKPKIVRVVGHAGEPDWAMLVSRRYQTREGKKVDVVIVRPKGCAPPVRKTVKAEHIRPAVLLDLGTTKPLLDRFVGAGVLSRRERQVLLAQVREALEPTTFKRKGVRRGVDRVAEGAREPADIGKGYLAKEFWRVAR